jgi:hypothetical protein
MTWRTIFRLRTVLAGAVATTLLTDVACDRKPQVSFSLLVPDAVKEKATWFEIGAFANAPCPPLNQFAGGIPASGTSARAAFHRDAKTRPALGDLARGSYAFAAVAKGDDCAVVAAGCSVVDVGNSNEVSIALKARDNPVGACGAGNVCENGQCVPPNDNAGDSVGADCSLEIIGGGPLDNPLEGNAIVSHPGIVATDNGFLLGYREDDPTVGEAQVTFISIDNGGAIHGITQRTLKDSCAGVEESDGIGLAISDDKALAVVARQPCNGKAGFHGFFLNDPFLLDSADSESIKYGIQVGADFNDVPPSLAPAHALGPAPGGEFFGAFLSGGKALVHKTASHVLPEGVSPNEFGRPGNNTAAWVTATDRLIAMMAMGTGTFKAEPLDGGVFDAGRDAGRDSGPQPVLDAGSSGPVAELRVNLVSVGANLGAIGDPYRIQAQSAESKNAELPVWASLSAQGNRLIVANSAPSGRAEFRIFDLGGSGESLAPIFGPLSVDAPAKPVLFADVAFHKDHAFFAIEQEAVAPDREASIGVVAYRGMAADKNGLSPAFIRFISLGQSTRIPRAVKDVRDGHVAIAASDTRVGIVWTTASKLTPNDATGGYAVLACR